MHRAKLERLDQRHRIGIDGFHRDTGGCIIGAAALAAMVIGDDAITALQMRGLRREHAGVPQQRSEEHTSELQSLMRISYAVFCLKKKTNIISHTTICT